MLKKMLVVTGLSLLCVGGLVYASQKWLTPIDGKEPQNNLPDSLTGDDAPTIGGTINPIDMQDTRNIMQGLGETQKPFSIETDPVTGQVKYIFSAETAEPDNTNNTINLKQPRIVYYIAEHRFMEISAISGAFLQRSGQPKSGAFLGDVKMKIFEGPAGQHLKYRPDLTPNMTIFFPGESKVNFDSIKSQIDSLDRLHLTSDEVEFKGRGLTLIFNERSNQIQELVVDRGEFLRYTQLQEAPIAPAPPVIYGQMRPPVQPNSNDAQQRPSMTERLNEIQDQRNAERSRKGLIGLYEDEDSPRGKSNQPGRIVRDSPTPSQGIKPVPRLTDYYQINIYDDIKIHTKEGHIRCKELEIYIANKPSKGDSVNPFGKRAQAPVSNPNHSPLSIPVAQLPLLAGDMPPAAPVKPHRFESVLQGADLHMTWTGRLVMRPLATDKEPPRRLVSYDDMFMRFIGTEKDGIYVETDNDDQVYCQTIDYQTEYKDAHLIGSKAHPLKIISSQSGELGGANELLVRLDTGIGHIPSGGYLQSTKDSKENSLVSADQDALALGGEKGMPEDFRIQWSKRFDFSFAPQRANDRGMRNARFDGDVIVTDPRFKMTSTQLVAEFVPSENSRNRQLSSIQTSGRTKATTDKGSTLEANSMRIETEEDANGKLQAEKMIARGKVIVQDTKQRIESEKLIAYLASQDEKEQARKDNEKSTNNLPVGLRRVYAEENVRLFMEDGSLVKSDTLESDVLKRDALLTGQPVHVTRDDNYFTTPTLKIQDNGQKVWGIGGGELYQVDDPADLKDTREKGKAPTRRAMRVTWKDTMFFNDPDNTVVFTGKVISKTTDKANELHRLDADKLTLFLTKKDEEGEADSEDNPTAGPGGSRKLKEMLAEKNVTMISTKWADPKREKIEQQFLLQGDHLVYDDIKKESYIDGPGVMFIQDLREDEKKKEKPEAKDGEVSIASAGTNLTGRGRTRFRWKDSWKAERKTNSLVMKGKVDMVHMAPDAKEPTELLAEEVTAKMKNLREMNNTQLTGGEEMTIDQIHFHGNAQLYDGRYEVAAGDMYYYAHKKTIRLEANRQRNVYIHDTTQTRPLRAQEILWYLESGKFEILKALHGG